jgi:serine/threonine protein kinase
MEYVGGQPILMWADSADASRDQRAAMFRQVCTAVAFAHRNLVVHRDITPSNVLVTPDGVVKLIDFGISRPVDEAIAASRPAGAPSLQSLSLTPGYAAPERLIGADVSTSADIYSLGKVLEKLLPGETGNPEFSAIVQKATAAVPGDRYPTVEALAADLDAYLAHRPVAAVKGGGAYRFRKYIRRHRIAAIATVSATALLLGAFAATAVSYVRAENARAAEAQRFDDVRQLANYLLFDLNEQLRRVPGNTSARADLAARAQDYLEALAASPLADRAVQLETANGFLRLAEIQGSPLERNLGERDLARANFDRARTLFETLRAEQGDDPDILLPESRLEANAALSAFYAEKDAERARALLDHAKALVAAVPEARRDDAWRLAEARVAGAELEYFASNEEPQVLGQAATAQLARIAGWPEALRTSDEAATLAAIARYDLAVSSMLTGDDVTSLPLFVAAHDALVALEAKNKGDPNLLYWIGWAGADAYAAGARMDGGAAHERLLQSSAAAARRLVAIEDKDESAYTLNVMSGELYAQHLGNIGRYADAIAEQRRIIEERKRRIGGVTNEKVGADLAFSEMMLGTIARKAGNRALTCEMFTSAEGHFAPIEAAGNLIAFHSAFLPGLRANLERCRTGQPLSSFGPLR